MMHKTNKGRNRASRFLNSALATYSTMHQEAPVWALTNFCDTQLQTVLTNHISISNIFKRHNLSGRLAHWYLMLQKYSSQFKYLPDRVNVMADALSQNNPMFVVTLTQMN